MASSTLTINFGTLAVPVMKTLTLLSEDKANGSYYRVIESEGTYEASIRHSVEKSLVNNLKVARHQALVRFTSAPDAVYPQGRVFEAYTIFRVPTSAPPSDAEGVASANTTFMYDKALNVIAGESVF